MSKVGGFFSNLLDGTDVSVGEVDLLRRHLADA